MPIEIIQSGHPCLRKVAEPVLVKDITSPKIKRIITRMRKALATQSDGVAIAAPQIGESVRIFVVSGKIFEAGFERGTRKTKSTPTTHPDIIYINPEIKKLSKKTSWLEEGCLSVRPIYGEVKRSLNATIQAYDEHGKKFERGAGGLLAHIFQHETDHLNGILFIDKARHMHENNLEEKENEQSKT